MLIKPRVLFIIGTLWGDNGITSHLTTLTKELMKHGWEVGLASGLASGQEGANEEAIRAIKRFESYGGKFFVVPFPELHLSAKNIADALKSLLKLDIAIRQFKPDVIHIHSLSVCPYVYIMRIFHKISVVSTCHLEPASDRLNVRVSKFVNGYLNLILGDRVIAISNEIKEVFKRDLKVSKDRIRLIYHGIETEKFRPPYLVERLKAREIFGLVPESKVVCLIARLNSVVKGHDVLIRAISILRSQGIEVIALCAGKGYGDEEDVIRAQASEANVSDLVHLLGVTDARQVLWSSDVLVLPSRREGFGLVIAEAMFCGVVSVRTPAAGAFDQIEDGINGYIVPFDDPEALALRLKQLLEDDELRAKMSVVALESAQRKFTASRMAKDTISVYEEVI
jgi:glycosyltransferase involved in cell wall biosynthesis